MDGHMTLFSTQILCKLSVFSSRRKLQQLEEVLQIANRYLPLMREIANCSLHTVDRYCTQCTVHSGQWTMRNAQCLHSAQCTQVTFGLSLSSSLHLLSQLRKPVGYEESCVDEPANTVVQAGFLPAGKAAAW